MKQTTITFDFDGTLYLTNDIKKRTFFDVVKDVKNGDDLMSSILKDKSLDRYQIFKYFSEKIYSTAKSKEIAKQFTENYSSTCFQNIMKSCRERDGKKNLFKFLRSINTKIYLISATPYKDLIKITNSLKITQEFLGIYGKPTKKENALLEIIRLNKLTLKK